LKKNGFNWTTVTQEAFDKYKTTLCITLILALPNFNKLFVLETDAYANGLGEVLCKRVSY
jgi:hypothetical protein